MEPSQTTEADDLARRAHNLLDQNDTATAGQVIYLLRLRYPEHPELEALEARRESLYHPTVEQSSFLEDLLQSFPPAKILIAIGSVIAAAGLILFISLWRDLKRNGFMGTHFRAFALSSEEVPIRHEVVTSLVFVVVGFMVILVALLRARMEDSGEEY